MRSKQEGSEDAGFVQPIFNYLVGVYKKRQDQTTSEEHSERMGRNSFLGGCCSTETEVVEISLGILKTYPDNALRTWYSFELCSVFFQQGFGLKTSRERSLPTLFCNSTK